MRTKKSIIRIFQIALVIVMLICMTGCAGGAPKGVSDEMYGYTKKISDTTHDFLDGKIERSETKELASISTDISTLVESESSEGLLDEKYYNDKEIATRALYVLLYLNADNSIPELESSLSSLDELLNNK